MQEIAELFQFGDGHCDDVRLRAEDKLAHINDQIKDLRKLRKALDKLILSTALFIFKDWVILPLGRINRPARTTKKNIFPLVQFVEVFL